jgi:hypothetical protein
MHMHVIDQANSSSVLAIMLADGVTGFRQMTGSPELLEERRDGTLPIGKDAPALLVMPGSLLTPFDAIESAPKYCDFECIFASNLHETRGRPQIEFGSTA